LKPPSQLKSADHFAALDVPRRPWIDPELLKAQFHSLSSTTHPDRFHSASSEEKQAATRRSVDLNAAFQCLREPKLRVRHLLELERGSAPSNLELLTPGAADFYFEIGRTCQEVDQFLSQRPASASPLLQVRLFEASMEWTEKLNACQLQLGRRRSSLVDELKELNPAWDSAPPIGSTDRSSALPVDRLERVYRDLSYVERWSEQLRVRIPKLVP
jgi:hypothetical protein